MKLRNKNNQESTAEPKGGPSTSTERSRRYRESIYKRKDAHKLYKAKDRARQMARYVTKWNERQNDEKLASQNREKEHLQKQRYRAKLKVKQAEDKAKSNKTDNAKNIKINALRHQARRYKKQIAELQFPKPAHSTPDKKKQKLLVSKALWNSLSPHTKTKSKRFLSDSNSVDGLNTLLRKELGVNLSNSRSFTETETPLVKVITEFIERDVSRVSPELKTVITKNNENIPVRYRMSTLKTLYLKFCAESSLSCCFSTFTRNIPQNIKRPSPLTWNTCLCVKCLNPELKLERLAKVKRDASICISESTSEEEFQESIRKIKQIKTKKGDTIEYVEWQLVDSPYTSTKKVSSKKAKKGYKVSRKKNVIQSKSAFLKDLVKELQVRQDHLHNCHAQFKAFKEAREDAMNSTVATIQIDWSENAKMTQAREEKKAYCEDCQVSVHTMHQWTSEGNQSVASLSDHTSHQAAAVMVSVKPVLESLIKNGKVKINIVSDSPTSQYRNKKIFYIIQQFANEYEVTVHWIYLEAGHGKGIPDGVGAVVKRAIKDIIMYNPDDPHYTVDQLIQSGLQDHLTSVKIIVYSEEDVNSLESKLPDIQ